MPDDRPVDPVVRELLTHILGEFEAAVGAHVLGYLFASEKPVDELLDEAEPGVLATLANLYVSTEELPDAESRRTYLRAMLFRTDDDGATLARHLRLASGGRDEVAQADDSASRALIAIAVDAYPAFLLPPNPLLPPEIPPFMREPVEVMIGVLRHPQTGAYAHAVRDDGQLAEMFSGDNPMVYRSTGQGSSLQLEMLPATLLRSAWRNVPAGNRSVEQLGVEVASLWRLVREAALGTGQTVPAVAAFAGVLLPPGTCISIGGGVLRDVTEDDRENAPESLRRKLSSGGPEPVMISYDGDVIFEFDFPYLLQKGQGQQADDPLPQWPADLRNMAANVDRLLTRLRASLPLALTREARPQIVLAWRRIDDPLDLAGGRSWADTTSAPLQPVRLTNPDVEEWAGWFERLLEPDVDRLEIALTRTLRALAERREPSDVLIDSVIVWENLFGSSQGETTLRVTASLALLLAQPGERRALRSKLAKIYTLRSKVVHGSSQLSPTDIPLCYEALDVAIRALRAVVESDDLIAACDGSERSLKLILRD